MVSSGFAKSWTIPNIVLTELYHFSPTAYGLPPLCLRLTRMVTHTSPRLDTKCGGSPLLGRHFQPLVTQRLVAHDKLTYFCPKSGKSERITNPNVTESGARSRISGHPSTVFVVPAHDIKLTGQDRSVAFVFVHPPILPISGSELCSTRLQHHTTVGRCHKNVKPTDELL